jgi:hypothetical protein
MGLVPELVLVFGRGVDRQKMDRQIDSPEQTVVVDD